MGQIFSTCKKSEFAYALIDGDIKYIKNNFKEEIDKWNFKDLDVDSPYAAPYTGDSGGDWGSIPYQSPVNILERVVYKANHDNEEIWNMMIYNGADVNLIGKFVQEPVSMIRGLISENYYWNRSVLEAAILKNKPNLVKVLIKYGANLNYKNPENDNKTPINLAFSEERNNIIKIIIDGKGVNYINNDGNTFLHLACKFNNIEIVKYLICNNANFNIKNKNLNTPFSLISLTNNPEIHTILNVKINNLKSALNRDFLDFNKETINLGIIDDNNNNDIKNSIKLKYQNLDISQLEIIMKEEYSYNKGCFSVKIKLKDNNEKYIYLNDSDVLKPEFNYVTKTKLNEISNIIENEPKVKQWLDHISGWDSTLPKAIDNAKKYTPESLYNWKRQEKEIIKGYIRDWSYISTLIEHELKIDELDKNIKGLKNIFEVIKKQVNVLDKRIENLNQNLIEKSQSDPNSWEIIISSLTVVGGCIGAIAAFVKISKALIKIGAGMRLISSINSGKNVGGKILKLFDSDDINSTDLQNQPSTSGYRQPRM